MRQPIPGAAALFIWAGAGAGVRVDFHREKIDKTTRGSKGEPPWHVFAFFLRAKKEGGPQAKPEKDGYGGLSAYTMRLYFKRAHAIKHDLCFGTLFLVDKKAGSNAVEIIRGLPQPSQKLPHLPEASSRNRERSVRGHSP